MAAPQDQYGQGYPAPDQYAQQSPEQPGFGTTSPPPPAGQPEDVGGKKKKRGYAAQAYDFGAGANSALGGQQQGGGQFQQPGGPPAPAYTGGYAGQPENTYGGAQYGAPAGTPTAGAPGAPYGAEQPQYGGGVGYQPPAAGYPGPGAPAQAYGMDPNAGGVAGITQGMGQMGVGGQPPAQPQQAAGRPAALNQLYPTDLLNQPFNVAELDLPPPPIILPPNVISHLWKPFLLLTSLSRVLPLHQMRTVLLNTCGQL
jgi:protein transport protein SEC24